MVRNANEIIWIEAALSLTGAGSLVGADAFVSLAAQWLQMGAASVIAGSWTVDWRHAETWLTSFQERWIGQRMPKAIAYRETLRMEVADGSSPLSRWAVFSLHGDWV